MIEVIILAAGVGSRLRPITLDVPKCMVPVNGIPLIGRLINQLEQHSSVSKINIVLGYKSEVVTEYFKGRNINFIFNKDYESTNNMYSFYLAIKSLSNLKDIIIINADCIYDDSIILSVFTSDSSCIMSDENFFNEESMKVEIKDNYVIGISKAYQKSENTFTSVDFYRLKEEAVANMIENVTQKIESGDLNSWTEVALNNIVNENKKLIKPRFIGTSRWYEIDNHADLEIANKLFANE
jgi:choline kinase